MELFDERARQLINDHGIKLVESLQDCHPHQTIGTVRETHPSKGLRSLPHFHCEPFAVFRVAQATVVVRCVFVSPHWVAH